MKTLKDCAQFADHTMAEYDDGTVTVMWHITKPDNTISGFTTVDYGSKAEYEIAKLDKATKERLKQC